ncbi:HD domain-containing protein, partial [Klebsiella pneumoniae]
MNIQAALRSGGVQRYHAQPDIPPQSTAEHMWGVAMLVMMFYPTASVTLLKAALSHDCGEVGLGDMPSPTKQAAPGVRQILKDMELDNMSSLGLEPWEEHLSETEKAALKICDVLEGLQYTA